MFLKPFFLVLFFSFISSLSTSIEQPSTPIIPPSQNYPQAPGAPGVGPGGGYPANITGFSGSAAEAMNYIVNRLHDIQDIVRDNDEHIQHIDQMISGTKQISQQLASINSITAYGNAVAQVHIPQSPYDNNSSSLGSSSLFPSLGQNQPFALNTALTQLPYGLQFDGNQFNGMGLGYVGNIMGLSGLPIGLDAYPPFMLISLNPQQFAIASSLAQPFMASSGNWGPLAGGLGLMAMNFFPMYMASNPLFNNIGGLSNLAGPLSWATLGAQNFFPNNLNAQVPLGSLLPAILGQAMIIGSNALVRPSTLSDPLYQSVMWTGNALQQLLFWINSGSLRNGFYSPINGYNYSNAYGLSPNLSDIYTAGAFGAVEDYLIKSNQRSKSNFLFSFVQNHAQEIVQCSLRAKPTEPVIPLERSDKAVFPYSSLLSFNNKDFTSEKKTLCEVGHQREEIKIIPVQFTSPSWGSGTLVTGISPQSYQSYMLLIQANTLRIQQNVAIERLDAQLYQDTLNVIQQLNQLEANLKSLRMQCQQNYLLAIPQISQLEITVVNQISNQQQYLERLKNNIENYRQTRYQLLLERLHIIEMMKEKAALEAGQAASHYLNEIQSQLPSTAQAETNM
ncbi:hypothetical protein IT6_00960 [Methylacidiphilum caldifontis]|nr:hypothetical protein IT6_00960 [Methylacidiphilum caldifontis]